MDKGKLKMDNCQLSTVNSQLRKNYKQTEMGIIPEDWDMKKLDSISSSVASGKSDTKPSNGIYPIYGSTGIIGLSNKFDYEGEKILVARVGANAGTVNWVTGKYCVSDNTLMVQLKNDVCFLYAVFFMRLCNLNKLVFGSGQPLITGSQLKQLPIPLPLNKAEQAAIATALSDADALISSLEKLIAKKRNIKQGAMQQLLTGKKRLPGFEKKKGCKQTEVGIIPSDWVIKKIGECLLKNPDYGINAAAVPYNEGLPVYLRITDIKEDGKYSKKNIVSVNNISSASYYLQEGDLVFARTGASVGKTYLFDPKDGKLVFAGFLIRVKANDKVLLPDYLKYFTQTKQYWNWIEANSMRTGQPGINGNEYKELIIPLPPTKAEQTAIAQVLSDMDAEIEALEKKLEKYKMIKQGMMRELLTGKTRLV
ncbi:MAG: restriction endonuclease subunit S [Candidatus Brocadia sp.]|nr:restriction endonuclease subunit S [Candidatus Brocadia sp.]